MQYGSRLLWSNLSINLFSTHIKIESNESNTNITNYNFRLLSINKQSIIHHKIDDGIDIDIDIDDDDNDEDSDDENPK